MHTLEELLLQLGLCDLNLDGLVDLLLVSSLVVGIVLDGGGEEGVDKGGLAQTGLASNLQIASKVSKCKRLGWQERARKTYHDGKGGTSLRDNLVALYYRRLAKGGTSKPDKLSGVRRAIGQIGNANRGCGSLLSRRHCVDRTVRWLRWEFGRWGKHGRDA